MTLRIELPWIHSENSPNYAGKLKFKLRAKKQAYHDGWWAAKEALDNQGPLNLDGDKTCIDVRLTFHPPDRRARDRDNAQASAKHELDGIAAALGVNDRLFRPFSDWGEVCKPGKVIVEIG